MLPSVSAPATANTPSPAPTTNAKRVAKAAEEFEGILIDNLWSGFQSDPLFGTADEGDAGAQSLQGLGLQAVSGAMAKSGGLGIAKMIEKQLASPLKSAPAAADTSLSRYRVPARERL